MKLLAKYQDFLLKNASQISAIEGTLRSLTYVLPGRFNDAEIASETLYSALNVLGLYHDFILVKATSSFNHPPSCKNSQTPSPHNKYTRYWINHSSKYKRIALILTIMQYTQIVIEMGVLKRWGKESKWKILIFMETLKVTARFYLLYLTRGKPIVNPPVPEREIDPAEIEECLNNHPKLKNSHFQDEKYNSLKNLNGNSIDNYLLSKVLTAENIKHPKDFLRHLNFLGKFGECLYIFRPLIYVIMIKKSGEKSWKPWIISLIIESISRIIFQKSTQYKRTSLEKDEIQRRTLAMLWNAFRGPFYDNYTNPLVNEVVKSMEKKPLLGLLAGIIKDYQPLWENYYFYSSAS